MHSEAGFRRLVNFSDAVVAIAITLLILPLVDSAANIGGAELGHFLADNGSKLLGFALSFVVIGRFWWAQHTMFERLQSYDRVRTGGGGGGAIGWTLGASASRTADANHTSDREDARKPLATAA